MTGPVYLTQPLVTRLPQILQDLRTGELRLPRFHRPFVWSDEQRLRLLDSIYRGLPIGSILIWRTKEHALRTHQRVDSLPLGACTSEPEGGGVKQYLLDGHQRLITLYTSLGEGLIDEEPSSEPGPGAENDEREVAAAAGGHDWRVYFDLATKEFLLPSRRAEAPPLPWLPLSILLDPYQLHEFLARLRRGGAEPALINRAQALANTFKDYSIPLVPVVTEDLELVTESFQRINSTGTDWDQIHMISALTWSEEFDLNESLQEIRQELGQVGWQELDDRVILSVCKAALGLNILLGETEAIQKGLDENPGLLPRVRDQLMKAAGFFNTHCHVHGPKTLPYSLQLVLLADALYLRDHSLEEDLPPGLADRLVRWFWLTTYTEAFGSSSSGYLRRTKEHLEEVVLQGGEPLSHDLFSREVRGLRRFDFRAARSKALALRLAARCEEEQKAYEVLAEEGGSATPMLIRRSTLKVRSLAEEPANRIVADPREFPDLRRKLQNEPHTVPPTTLEAHAISKEALAALERQDWARFIEERRKTLDEIERDFVTELGLEYVVE